MESATFRKWLEERGCRFDRHEHQPRHQGHIMVTAHREDRKAEVPLKIDPVRMKFAALLEDSDRSELEHEGNAMLRLMLGRAPSGSRVCEYVDAIRAVDGGRPLGLPHWALAPGVLKLLEGPILFRRGLMHAVWRRMNIAFQIGETEPAPSRYFRTRSVSVLTAVSTLFAIGATEALRMVRSATLGSVLAVLAVSRRAAQW